MKKADYNFKGRRGSIPPQLFRYIDTANMAKYNFWSACGDSNDYDYFIYCRRKLKECKSRTK